MNWLIISDGERDDQGRRLFWHNDHGWVGRSLAQAFSDEDRNGLQLPIDGRWTSEFEFECIDWSADVTYEPWTDGWAVGYKVTLPGTPDRVRYFYMNPSGGSDLPNDPTIFVYEGTEGDPAKDFPLHHYNVGSETQ